MNEPQGDRHDWEITLDAKRPGIKSMRTYRGYKLGVKTALWLVLALWAGTWGGILLLGIWIGSGL